MTALCPASYRRMFPTEEERVRCPICHRFIPLMGGQLLARHRLPRIAPA